MNIFVIAEAGVNHDGEILKALKLIDAAKRTGADAVKFQMFNSQRLWGDSRISHLEMDQHQMRTLAAYAKSLDIEFLCTPFGVPEVEFLAPLVKRIKIASGCIRRTDLLAAVKATNMPVIMSTGMSDFEEVSDASRGFGDTHLTLLHCTSSYPCAIKDANLAAMATLRYLDRPVGYSDHTQGITVAIAAAAMGATVIEKHMTLDRTAEGPDHRTSIEPEEFRVMVSGIRMVEEAIGDGRKCVMPCEMELRKAWR